MENTYKIALTCDEIMAIKAALITISVRNSLDIKMTKGALREGLQDPEALNNRIRNLEQDGKDYVNAISAIEREIKALRDRGWTE